MVWDITQPECGQSVCSLIITVVKSNRRDISLLLLVTSQWSPLNKGNPVHNEMLAPCIVKLYRFIFFLCLFVRSGPLSD